MCNIYFDELCIYILHFFTSTTVTIILYTRKIIYLFRNILFILPYSTYNIGTIYIFQPIMIRYISNTRTSIESSTSCDTKLNILCVCIMFCAISTHLTITKVFLSFQGVVDIHFPSCYGRYSGKKHLEIIVAVIHFHINDTALFMLSLSQIHICHLQIPLYESRKRLGMAEKMFTWNVSSREFR